MTLSITLTISGKDLVLRRLSGLSKTGERLERIVGARVREARDKLEATKYPVERPGQIYQRRYMAGLQGGYVVEKQSPGGDSVAYVIANRALDKRGRSFSVFVIGYGDKEGGQARIHRGHWWLGRNIVKPVLSKIATDIKTEWDKGG